MNLHQLLNLKVIDVATTASVQDLRNAISYLMGALSAADPISYETLAQDFANDTLS